MGVLTAAIVGSAVKGAVDLYSARQNRKFQKKMSDTSYQRQMADMEKAGLNPILAAKMGGASTPAGAMAQMPDFGQTITQGVATGLQAQHTEANVKKIEQEVENLRATEGLTNVQTENITQMTYKAWEETNNLMKEGQRMDYENVVRAILTKFKQDNPDATILQEFGMDLTSVTGRIVHILNQMKEN